MCCSLSFHLRSFLPWLFQSAFFSSYFQFYESMNHQIRTISSVLFFEPCLLHRAPHHISDELMVECPFCRWNAGRLDANQKLLKLLGPSILILREGSFVLRFYFSTCLCFDCHWSLSSLLFQQINCCFRSEYANAAVETFITFLCRPLYCASNICVGEGITAKTFNHIHYLDLFL